MLFAAGSIRLNRMLVRGALSFFAPEADPVRIADNRTCRRVAQPPTVSLRNIKAALEDEYTNRSGDEVCVVLT
jgi:hypothetical protein